MYNRIKENSKAQKVNINKRIIKKTSPIKIKSNNEIKESNYNPNKINFIQKENQNKINNQKPSVILPKINNNKKIINQNNNINKKQSSILSQFNNNLNNNLPKKRSMTGNKIKKPPVVELRPYQRNKKMFQVKKRFIRDNNLYTIISFLDIRTFYYFMLCCKQFYKLASQCDDIWYNFYIIKFCKPPKEKIQYNVNRGQWRQLYLSTSKSIYMKNYEDLKTKYLKKYKKNIYTAKKDPYYLTNNLYKNLKNPLYAIEIDKTIYKVKYILTNKILSHINFFANFDESYQDLHKIKTIKLLFTEQNIGIFRKPIAVYDMKKIKLNISEAEGIINKIFKIYYHKDFIRFY